MPSKVTRWLKALRRELLWRNIPHGMVSWRYLSTSNPQIEAHRQIFWTALPGMPKPLYVLVEAILWLKWAGLFGWLALFRALRGYGTRLRDERGVSRPRQFCTLVRISIGACMPPGEAYRFGLVEHPARLWNYVSDRHIAAFHRWRNSRRAISPETTARLADKAAATDFLQARGIPMAPILAIASADTGFDFAAALEKHRRLFCKSRSGNRGLGAFECWKMGQVIEGRTFEGDPLPDRRSVMAAWEALLQLDIGLVQPALQNHPQLAPLVPDGRAITVRCITRRSEQGSSILSATLEIPTMRKPSDKRDVYVILPVDAESGLVQPIVDDMLLLAEARQNQRDMLAQRDDHLPLPDWQSLIDHSLAAHDHYADFWAIAWDWVLTPQGPILLEGNNGFGGSLPQILTGGFLSELQTRNRLASLPG
ncbi:sugar-transfer associated ATP-grasp domain-containing protein [Sphingorhabdus sp. YGSMI21]|uniref:sugar-transfer associated ATP-grasp domain-containing protein n=1 Tax=Sphingorhabdus sp. YGSMI21 TaxID=2077182 RepID=UPI0013DC38FC|nr:sugar-transfer associated ATP-grasp domain-containing protein [Sphingorhabdus sp. YGSMI21]